MIKQFIFLHAILLILVINNINFANEIDVSREVLSQTNQQILEGSDLVRAKVMLSTGQPTPQVIEVLNAEGYASIIDM